MPDIVARLPEIGHSQLFQGHLQCDLQQFPAPSFASKHCTQYVCEHVASRGKDLEVSGTQVAIGDFCSPHISMKDHPHSLPGRPLR